MIRRNRDRHLPFKCPGCGGRQWRMTDGRPSPHRDAYRRRRECLHCGVRITTYEAVDSPDVFNADIERVALFYLRRMAGDRLKEMDAADEPSAPITAETF